MKKYDCINSFKSYLRTKSSYYNLDLSNEELVNLYQNNQDDIIFETLCLKNIRVFYTFMNKYMFCLQLEECEFLNVCLETVHRCMLDYSKSSGSFINYLYHALKNNLITFKSADIAGGSLNYGRRLSKYFSIGYELGYERPGMYEEEAFKKITQVMIERGLLKDSYVDNLKNCIDITFNAYRNRTNISEDEVYNLHDANKEIEFILYNFGRLTEELTTVEFTILTLRFGIGVDRIYKFEEIGDLYNVSHQAIEQRMMTIMNKLKKKAQEIKDEGLFDCDEVSPLQNKRKRKIETYN